MKEQEARFQNDHQLVWYVEKADGRFAPMQTGSYMVDQYIDDYLAKRQKLEQEYGEKLLNGEISPIEYYRVLVNLSEMELARRIGISKRKVVKHKNPERFQNITVKLLQKYAAVFRVPLANLFQLFVKNETGRQIFQQKSDNPYVVLSIIKEA